MYEEKIFGPFTFRQFIYIAIGFGIVYFAYNKLAQNISIPIIILVIISTFVFVKRATPAPFSEEYLRIKKSELGKEDFQRWCKGKIAMVQSQISMRELKGFKADPSFNKMKELLEKAISDSSVN